MRSSSTSASPSPSVVRRDVSTQAVVRPPATRDVSVGHQPTTRNVGVQPSETVYSKEELELKSGAGSDQCTKETAEESHLGGHPDVCAPKGTARQWSANSAGKTQTEVQCGGHRQTRYEGELHQLQAGCTPRGFFRGSPG